MDDLGDEALRALRQVALLARQGVAGCVAAGISLRRDQGLVQTVTATGAAAQAVDDAQYVSGDGPCVRALTTGTPVTVGDLAADDRWPAVSRAAAAAGIRSVLSLPLALDGRLFGALNLYATDAGVFPEQAREAGEAFARQASVTLRYLQLFRVEHAARAEARAAAETLQRSLLPDVVPLPGLAAASRYLASEASAQVGGDWYDLIPLPDGAVGVAVGDVMGHSLAAAAAMGQLRSVLRSYAWEGHPPGAVLDRLDRLVQGLGMAQTATACYGRLHLRTGSGLLHYANAGHLPPLLCEPDGTARLLDGARSPLIGAPRGEADFVDSRQETEEALAAGATLVLYTDGLVEGRHRPLADGLEQLRNVAAGHEPEDGPDALCDRLVDALIGGGPGAEDDVALLAVYLLP
ncbi:MAG: PP2C family protein-serine/threonine phosphatase [Streptosporangiaceae bacterium]